MNKKGFFMMEALAVIVFVAGIFTFLYVSILPLLGTYNDLIARDADINIVYKLYHIRMAIQKDNKVELNRDFMRLTCDDFKNVDYCNNLMRGLNLTNYDLFYTKSIHDNIDSFTTFTEVYDYLQKYIDSDEDVLILHDKVENTIVHLAYYELNPSNIMGTFTSKILAFKESITEVHFLNMDKKSIDLLYDNASSSMKDVITYLNNGVVKCYIDGTKLYVLADGITYLSTGNNLFNGFTNLKRIYFNDVNTINVVNMDNMFYNCNKLESIYVRENWNINDVTSSTNMFYNCTSLIGGFGTRYSSSNLDKTYARIDSDSAKGYFIYKALLPSNYQNVDYIEGTGTQYIDLEFVTTKGMRADISASFTGNSNVMLIGSHNLSEPWGRNYVKYSPSTYKWELGYGDVFPTVTSEASLNKRYGISYSSLSGNAYLKVNGNSLITNTSNYTTSFQTVYLFTNSYELLNNNISSYRLHYAKIYDSNNNLIRELIPCYRKSDGYPGLFDILNSKFYTKIGTNNFVKGFDI